MHFQILFLAIQQILTGIDRPFVWQIHFINPQGCFSYSFLLEKMRRADIFSDEERQDNFIVGNIRSFLTMIF